MKRKIIVACGGAVATSTMAAEEIKELCQSHHIPVELIQCRVNEIETYMDGVHLICTTAKVDRSFGDIPLVHGMPFVSGVGIEAFGFAPIFPDICYHLTHYKPAAADIPVASDNPAHYADAIRYNARTPLQGSLLPLTRLVWA